MSEELPDQPEMTDSAEKGTAAGEGQTPAPGGEPTHEDVTSEPASTQETGLRRSAKNRKIGGVAAGVGERFDIDANFVRVGFVVLTFLWGLGAAIYLAMWALVPLAGTTYETEIDEGPSTERRRGFRRYVLLLAVAFSGLILLAIALHGLVIGRGLSLVWLIFLVGLAILSLRRPVRRLSLTRLVAGLFILMLSFVILATGAVLSYLALAGVPFTGGLGQAIYQPTSLAQVHRTYRMAAGSMTIDLRNVPFSHHAVTITSTVGIGTLNIAVPRSVIVDLTAASGSRNVNYPFGQQQFFVAPGSSRGQGRIELNVKVGIGSVNLFRAAPGQWLPMG